MLSVFIQATFLFLVVIFQISFLNVIFAGFFVSALLSTAVALILTRGFFAAWPWILFLGCVYDMLSLDIIGTTAIVLIVLAYGISFLSRRFLVEHRASGTILAVLFVALFSVIYLPLIWMVRHFITGSTLPSESMRLYFLHLPLVSGMLLNAGVFLVLYIFASKINHMLDFYEDRVIVKR